MAIHRQHAALDVQNNGDACRHDIVFDNIRVEYKKSCTPSEIPVSGTKLVSAGSSACVDAASSCAGFCARLSAAAASSAFPAARAHVIGLVDSTGALVVEYKYDVWGKRIGRTGSLAATLGTLNPFLYRGYVYDEETGLYYLQSRYYKPEICRFINVDDASYLGANDDFISYNLFAYCLNNPVNRTDDSGNLSLPNWAKVAIGAVATVAATVVTVATGGAAAPVLISVAMSTAVSGAVGYATGGR